MLTLEQSKKLIGYVYHVDNNEPVCAVLGTDKELDRDFDFTDLRYDQDEYGFAHGAPFNNEHCVDLDVIDLDAQ